MTPEQYLEAKGEPVTGRALSRVESAMDLIGYKLAEKQAAAEQRKAAQRALDVEDEAVLLEAVIDGTGDSEAGKRMLAVLENLESLADCEGRGFAENEIQGDGGGLADLTPCEKEAVLEVFYRNF